MPVIVFPPARERETPTPTTRFIRFLLAHPAHPELVEEMDFNTAETTDRDAVYAVLRSLRPREAFAVDSGDRPFDVLQNRLAALSAEMTDEGLPMTGHGWIRGSLDNFLESILLVPGESVEKPEEAVLLVPDDPQTVWHAVALAFEFGGSSGRLSIARLASERGTPGHCALLMERPLSSFPFHYWQSRPYYRLYGLLRPDKDCYVEWGFSHPVPEIADLHTGLVGRVAIALVSSENGRPLWRWIPGKDRFETVPYVADVHLSGRTPLCGGPQWSPALTGGFLMLRFRFGKRRRWTARSGWRKNAAKGSANASDNWKRSAFVSTGNWRISKTLKRQLFCVCSKKKRWKRWRVLPPNTPYTV